MVARPLKAKSNKQRQQNNDVKVKHQEAKAHNARLFSTSYSLAVTTFIKYCR